LSNNVIDYGADVAPVAVATAVKKTDGPSGKQL